MTYPDSFTNWTVSDMIGKFRLVTGSPSQDQISNAGITAYLNQAYVYVMPFELKEQIENQFLNFKTTPGIDVYSFPSGYFTDQPGAYADGFPLVFYQDPDIFYQDWPEQYAVDNIASGDGVTITFAGGLQNPPIIEGTLFISSVDMNDVTIVAQDIGVVSPNVFPDGTLTGIGIAAGSINYLTGAYSVTYSVAPSASAVIYAKYQGYQGNRPQGVLFFNNQFTLRPVPDQVYQIKMQGYIQPAGFIAPTDGIPSTQIALQAEWGAYIVYAAALELFSDRGDLENYQRYFPIFKRYENVALGRIIQQLSAEQSVGRF